MSTAQQNKLEQQQHQAQGTYLTVSKRITLSTVASEQLRQQQAAITVQQRQQEDLRQHLESQIRAQVEEEVRQAVAEEMQRRQALALQTGN